MPQEESKLNELSKLFIINYLLSYYQPSSDWTYAEMWGWTPYSLQMPEPCRDRWTSWKCRTITLVITDSEHSVRTSFEQMPRSQKKQIPFPLNRFMDFFCSCENWTMLIEKDKIINKINYNSRYMPKLSLHSLLQALITWIKLRMERRGRKSPKFSEEWSGSYVESYHDIAQMFQYRRQTGRLCWGRDFRSSWANLEELLLQRIPQLYKLPYGPHQYDHR